MGLTLEIGTNIRDWDCIDSYFDALSALWLLFECSLSANWLLTFSWPIAWRFEPEWWRLTSLDKFGTNERTLWLLGLLLGPKRLLENCLKTDVEGLSPKVQTERDCDSKLYERWKILLLRSQVVNDRKKCRFHCKLVGQKHINFTLTSLNFLTRLILHFNI